MNLKDKISEFPNFPKKGILFRDFSPILKDPSALSFIADEFSKNFHQKDIDLFADALAVPPVASKSSQITIRWPFPITSF